MDTLIEIDAAAALAGLDAAVEARGADYRYNDYFMDCEYVVDGAPACVVGEVFVKAGADIEALHHVAGTVLEISQFYQRDRAEVLRFGVASKPISEYATDVLLIDSVTKFELKSVCGIELSDSAVRILSAAQAVQDGLGTWGEARDAGYEVARLILGDDLTNE